MMDYLVFAVTFLLALLLGRVIARQKEEREIDKLEEFLKSTVFVMVEKHEHNGKTVFLMFKLSDDSFLFQSESPAELVASAKAKWPNKLIVIHGNEDLSTIPEFNEVKNSIQGEKIG
jgi:hypothetical protein